MQAAARGIPIGSHLSSVSWQEPPPPATAVGTWRMWPLLRAAKTLQQAAVPWGSATRHQRSLLKQRRLLSPLNHKLRSTVWQPLTRELVKTEFKTATITSILKQLTSPALP